MMNMTGMFILFLFAFTLHNAEEAIWLPQWSIHAKKFHKSVNKDEFRFAVILYTMLAYLAAGLMISFPEVRLLVYFFIGFLGAMILNAFLPHLLATIVLRRYAPGTATGVFLILPINSLIIFQTLNNGILSFQEVVLSTIAVAILLLGLLKPSFSIGRKLVGYLSE